MQREKYKVPWFATVFVFDAVVEVKLLSGPSGRGVA